MRFSVETIDPNSATPGRGRITVYNEITAPQALKPFTRFVTEDGIVYKSSSWVNVPGARIVNGITEIGSTEVSVVADPIDVSGRVVGAR
jgi:hypothetical protein